MIIELLKKIINRERYSSVTYCEYLRKLGVTIGNGTTIFYPKTVFIDESRPYLISIGNNVNITRGVTILTHGFDWSVLKGVYGEVLGSSGGVHIGDNVFVGMQSTILKGVRIGNNVIIGANSLVTKDIPDNCVAAGNPCKVIMTLDEYYDKRKTAQIAEASELVQLYRNKYGFDPSPINMHEFFWLFENDPDNLEDCYLNLLSVGGNESDSLDKLRKNDKKFEDLNDFLNQVI